MLIAENRAKDDTLLDTNNEGDTRLAAQRIVDKTIELDTTRWIRYHFTVPVSNSFPVVHYWHVVTRYRAQLAYRGRIHTTLYT